MTCQARNYATTRFVCTQAATHAAGIRCLNGCSPAIRYYCEAHVNEFLGRKRSRCGSCLNYSVVVTEPIRLRSAA